MAMISLRWDEPVMWRCAILHGPRMENYRRHDMRSAWTGEAPVPTQAQPKTKAASFR
jgi:hypothetical protein